MMKYIKTYERFSFFNFIKKEPKLESKLKKFGIENYTINDNGTINTNGYINLADKKLDNIPFKFKKVTGSFDCSCNNLISLEGCPIEVGENFFCSLNKLTSLEYCPQKIDSSLYCTHNKLVSLKGLPIEIDGYFNCSYNQLISLEYCSSEINQDFDCSRNRLTMLDCSSYVKGDIYCWGNEFTEEPEFFGDCEGKIIWKIG